MTQGYVIMPPGDAPERAAFDVAMPTFSATPHDAWRKHIRRSDLDGNPAEFNRLVQYWRSLGYDARQATVEVRE